MHAEQHAVNRNLPVRMFDVRIRQLSPWAQSARPVRNIVDRDIGQGAVPRIYPVVDAVACWGRQVDDQPPLVGPTLLGDDPESADEQVR